MEIWCASPLFGAWVLAATRLAGMCLLAPLLGPALLPVRLKLAAVGTIALCVELNTPLRGELVTAASESLSGLSHPVDGWLLLVSELLLGAALGWGCLLVLGAVRGACSLLSQQIGLSAAAVVDPLTSQEGGTLADFYSVLAVCVFLLLDLHHTLIRAVAESFLWVGPGKLQVDMIPELLGRLALQVGPDLLQAAVTLALPVLVAMLLVTLVQGLLGRALPNTELLMLGLPIRLLVGIGVLVISLPASAGFVHLLFERATDDGRELIEALGWR